MLFRVSVAALMILGLAGAAIGESIPRQGSRIATPSAQGYKVHNFYAGALLGYSWGIEDKEVKEEVFVTGNETVQGGVLVGYLFRPNEFWGVGVEVDHVVRDLGEFSLDDGFTSIRGRLGVYVAPGAFVYGTAGVAYTSEVAQTAGLDRGIVVGGGFEKDVTPNAAVRAEILYYTHGDEYFDWGEESSTVGRVGLLFKF